MLIREQYNINTMKISYFVIILFLFVFSISSLTYGETIKIGVVDIQKIMQESEKGKKVLKDFESGFKEKRKKLESMNNELEKLKKEIFENISMWSNEVKEKKEEEFNQKLKKYQREKEDLDEQMIRKNSELNQKMVTEIMELLKEVSKKENYTIIFEKGSLLYVSPSIDITNKIIEKYDASMK